MVQFSPSPSPSVPFWVLEILSQRGWMPGMHRASGPVTTVCFCHSFPVRLTSASTTVSCGDLPVTPEIQMGSAPSWLDGIRVHCAPVSNRALYSWGSDVPGHLIHTPGCPFLPPGWRQGLSSLGHSIHYQHMDSCGACGFQSHSCYSLLVNTNQ